MSEDTIIAVSTPAGQGGLGIIRISGRKALSIGRRIFRTRRPGSFRVEPLRPTLGRLYDYESRTCFDEAFLTYFKAPRSYTREDVVELSCHGSPVILERAVRLGVKAGARAAHPGEFTLRAYLHGRIDILQAEAVNDLIRAVSAAQAAVSFRQMSGSLSRKIADIREKIIRLAAQIEAVLEFPEENLRISKRMHAKTVERILGILDRLIGSFEAGRAMRDGLEVAIVGRKNVGKSTLFNSLLGEDRAIVTPFPGTTRDFLREKIILGNGVLQLVDMAGFGSPGHPVEKAGIGRGRKIADEADGLLIVVDGSQDLSSADRAIIQRYKGKKKILVVNKSDLPEKIGNGNLLSLKGKMPMQKVSARRGDGMRELKQKMHEFFVPAPDFHDEIILHVRQRNALEELRKTVRVISGLLGGDQPEEIIAEEVKAAVALVGSLTGEIKKDEIMNDIFGRFCVGK